MFKRTATPFAAGAIFAVLVAGGGAYAATGGDFILGKKNVSGKTSTLTSKRGPALSLNAKGPALRVNNGSKIAKLNADKLDGKNSSAFMSRGARSWSYDYYGVELDFDEDGATDALGGRATCPRGTELVSGGFADYTATGATVQSSPDVGGREAWTAFALVDETVTADPDDYIISVTCWSPTGAEVDPDYAYRHAKAPSFSPAERRILKSKVAAR